MASVSTVKVFPTKSVGLVNFPTKYTDHRTLDIAPTNLGTQERNIKQREVSQDKIENLSQVWKGLIWSLHGLFARMLHCKMETDLNACRFMYFISKFLLYLVLRWEIARSKCPSAAAVFVLYCRTFRLIWWTLSSGLPGWAELRSRLCSGWSPCLLSSS